MGLQLVFCVEADAQSKSDFMYIRSLVDEYYIVDQSSIKLSPVYMGGKGNYSSKKIKRRIDELKKHYDISSDNNRTVIIFCFDCDNYDKKTEDKSFLQAAEQYCDNFGYKFVWFCRDIEDVFWGKHVSDNQKKSEAVKFTSGRHVGNVNLDNLRTSKYRRKCSNLAIVLDDLLKTKS